ncbi:Ig-like V-type domain-containing protein FAM187A, partial [Dinothrombium tinctorium]
MFVSLQPNQSAFKLWRFSPPKFVVVKPINLKNDRLHIASDIALEISSVTIDDTGTYYCIYNRKVETKYTLDVVVDEPQRIIVDSHSGIKSNGKALKEWTLEKNNLKLETRWSEWSSCSTCDRVGLRKKIGICTVSKLNADQETKPSNIPVFHSKENSLGIPCRSYLLPKSIANLEKVKKRHSETMYGFCNVSCPDKGIETVTDPSGKLIETIDRSKNLYSFRQKLPPLPKFVRRETVFEDKGSKIVLACP